MPNVKTLMAPSIIHNFGSIPGAVQKSGIASDALLHSAQIFRRDSEEIVAWRCQILVPKRTEITPMRPAKTLGLTAVLFGVCFFARATPAEDQKVEFLRDVRPILAGHCFKCHGPDEEARKSKLRLDIREEALKPAKSGKIAIQPNDPDKSELVRRILTSDTDDQMPPPEAKLPLSEKDKAILKQWVASGAEYKTHWAFLKPTQTALPPVKN